MAKVSVIVPTYNVEQYLVECMDSIINQTLGDIEIICVDDGSTDKSGKILDEYASRDNRVKVIHKENGGYGKAMNVGLDNATGEYIGIVEPDDYVDLTMFEILYQKAVELDLDLIKADFNRFIGDKENRDFFYNKLDFTDKHYNKLINLQENLVPFYFTMNTWSGIYKRGFLNKYNIRHHESAGASFQDNGFWFQTFAFAQRAYFLDKPFYNKRDDNENSSVKNKGKVYAIANEYDWIYQKLFVNNEVLKNRLIDVYWQKRLDNHMFTLKRIDKKFVEEYLNFVKKDCSNGIKNHELVIENFNTIGQENLKLLFNNPKKLYKRLKNKRLWFEYIFSITNMPSKEGKWYKVVYILGLKFSLRNKKKENKVKYKNYYEFKNCPVEHRPTMLKEWYFNCTGETLDLENPQTYNEKIQWLKLYDSTPLKTRLADKYLVREWVKEKIGEKYLIPLLGVWDKFDDIDFDKLPNQFVLKCNHGSGYNIIVKDKTKLNLKEAKNKINEWMNEDFAFRCGFEMHYSAIPHKIIAEKYIEQVDNQVYDYKFICFNGEPKLILVDKDRFTQHKRNIYDLNWNLQDMKFEFENSQINDKKPYNLLKMIEFSKILSKDFPLVRVDFYECHNQLFFGEMTFTPDSGINNISPKKLSYELGLLIELPKLNESEDK